MESPSFPHSKPVATQYFPSVRLHDASGTSGGLVLQWRSLDGMTPVNYYLALTPDPAWDSVPLSLSEYDGFCFCLSHSTLSMEPPAENPLWGPIDQGMIDAFIANFDEMNQTVAASLEASRNTPPPAPPSPDSRRFVRIIADWSLDTDGDGSPDWAEFELLADPNHPQYSLANAYSSDINNDGIPDGEQLDSDGDTIPDFMDAGLGDSMVRWEKSPHRLYALFELPYDSSDFGQTDGPFQIDDMGRILFSHKVWDRGITRSFGEGTWLSAMNDHGVIVGAINHDDDGDGNPDGPVMAWWPSADAPHQVVEDGTFRAQTSYDLAYALLQPGTVVSDSGMVVGITEQKIADASPRGYHWESVGRGIWSLPLQGGLPSVVPTSDFINHVHHSGYSWGYDYSSLGTVASDAPLNQELIGGGYYPRMVELPEDNLVFLGDNVPAKGNLAGQWITIPSLDDVHDLSSDGTGIMTHGYVWRNSHPKPLIELAPDSPALWHQDAELLDIASSGAILVGHGGNRWSPDLDKVASALPVWVEDDIHATGVDNISATALTSDPAVAGRLWIMAPEGASPANLARIHMPASPQAPVGLTAQGATAVPASLNGLETEVAWAGTLPDTTDTTISFTMGSATSQSLPLGVKIMKRRTVKLHLWHVASAIHGQDPINPELTFSKAEVEAYLDEIYGKQVNAYWDVTVDGLLQPALVNWDIADEADFGGDPNAPHPLLNPGNGKLDSVESEPSVEQNKVASSSRTDADADINAYIVGGSEGICFWANKDGALSRSLSYDGLAHPQSRKVWLPGMVEEDGPGALETAKARALRTLAHEIGHVMMGGGHPNGGGGVAPLPGTRQSDRLMFSSPFSPITNGGRLLVKREWDEIDLWLTAIVDNPDQ